MNDIIQHSREDATHEEPHGCGVFEEGAETSPTRRWLRCRVFRGLRRGADEKEVALRFFPCPVFLFFFTIIIILIIIILIIIVNMYL